MALNSEDKADVSRSMGKALANKVGKVTRDKDDKTIGSTHFPGEWRRTMKRMSKVTKDKRSPAKIAATIAKNNDPRGYAKEIYRVRKENRVPSGVNYKAHGKGLNGPKN